MKIFRPIISLCLVLVTTLLVSCSGATQAKVPTIYAPEKIEQLQEYLTPIVDARGRMGELQELINDENWVDTRTFIHGPLGALRQDMTILNRKLLEKDKTPSQQLSRELFSHLERIDAAAKERNSNLAKAQYNEAITDFDLYIDFIPHS